MDISLREMATTWSLNSDKQLLNTLQGIHEKIKTKSMETKAKLECLMSSLNVTALSLDNTNNGFKGLNSGQFMESRVYEDDDDIACSVVTKKEEVAVPVKKSNKLSARTIEVLQKYHEEILFADSDLDSSSDDENQQRIILILKNMYADRPLPRIIGSDPWKMKWHAGLLVEDSDDDSTTVKGDKKDEDEYSETDEEVQPKPITTPADTKPTVSKEESTESAAKVDIPVVISESDPVIDEKLIPIFQPKNQSAFAAELANRLSGQSAPTPVPAEKMDPVAKPTENKTNVKHIFTDKIQQNTIVPSRIFPNEPPPLTQSDDDDIFAYMHKTDSNQNDDANDLFQDDFFDDFSNPNVTSVTSSKGTTASATAITPRNDVDKNKNTVGAVPQHIFKKDSDSVGKSIKNRYRKQSSSDDEDILDIYKNALLSDANKNKETSLEPCLDTKTQTIDSTSRSSQSFKKPNDTNKKFILNDDIFDDVDDLFSTDFISKPKPKVSVKLFEEDDDDDTLFSDIIVKSKEVSYDKKEAYKENRDEISDIINSEEVPPIIVTQMEVKENIQPANNLSLQPQLDTPALPKIMPKGQAQENSSVCVENKINTNNEPSILAAEANKKILKQESAGNLHTCDTNNTISDNKNSFIYDTNIKQSQILNSDKVLSSRILHSEQSVETKIVNNMKETRIGSTIVDDVDYLFIESPPKIEKSKDNKVSKNVNALFGDDSEDESLFFKRSDTEIKDREHTFLPGLLYDEPPLLIPEENHNHDVDYFVEDSKNFDQKKEIQRVPQSEKKTIGKIKSTINIDVNALLPGATLMKNKSDFVKHGDIPKSSSNLEDFSKHSIVSTNLVKSLSFEDDRESPILCNNISKERAKIQVKRRPSSRKARKNAINVSSSCLDDQTEQSTNNIEKAGQLDITANTGTSIGTKTNTDTSPIIIEDENSTEISTTFDDSQQEKSEILSSDNETIVADEDESATFSKDHSPFGHPNKTFSSGPEAKHDDIVKTIVPDNSSHDELIIQQNSLLPIVKKCNDGITANNEAIKRGAIPKTISHKNYNYESRHKSSDSEEDSDCESLFGSKALKGKSKRSQKTKKSVTTSDLSNLKDKSNKLTYTLDDDSIRTIGKVYSDIEYTRVDLGNKGELIVKNTNEGPQTERYVLSYGVTDDDCKTKSETVAKTLNPLDQKSTNMKDKICSHQDDSDEDIFATFAKKKDDSSGDELIIKSSPNTLTRIVKPKTKVIEKVDKEATKVAKKKVSVFDSSSDEEIFGGRQDIFSKNTNKSTVKKAIQQKSLFDDDSDEGLFGKSSTDQVSSISVPVKTDSKVIESVTTNIEQVFQDPLGACKDPEEEQFF